MRPSSFVAAQWSPLAARLDLQYVHQNINTAYAISSRRAPNSLVAILSALTDIPLHSRVCKSHWHNHEKKHALVYVSATTDEDRSHSWNVSLIVVWMACHSRLNGPLNRSQVQEAHHAESPQTVTHTNTDTWHAVRGRFGGEALEGYAHY